MAKIDLVLPKMGESIIEATIINWTKKPGDTVEQDETIVEIATDKVDSEVPSPVTGVVVETFFKENEVVPIGSIIALIATDGEQIDSIQEIIKPEIPVIKESEPQDGFPAEEKALLDPILSQDKNGSHQSDRFYSPLVKSIAKEENLSLLELDAIPGSGQGGRVTKHDIIAYIKSRGGYSTAPSINTKEVENDVKAKEPKSIISEDGSIEIVEMNRMRRLIADHMVKSKLTSPHVSSFVEADVTNLVKWREKHKASYLKKYGEKITFTPLFMEAIIKSLKEFPLINSSLEGNKILIKKYINIGMAAALPSGNLIVPVIKNADHLSLKGLVSAVNDMAVRARNNDLKPDEIQNGTFTFTNIGTFGNVMGTPIINQPQVAILAFGTINKKPAVIETEDGDVIGIRHKMFLSMSYDHRIIDGFMGGSFLKKVADHLENFDKNRIL